jgi:hypothetical protein
MPLKRGDRRVDKRRVSHPLPQAAFKLASPLRNPGLAHALVKPLALSEKGCTIALHGGPEAGNGEARIGCKASLDGRMRFLDLAEVRQGCREVELCNWMIAIDFNGAPRTRDGLLVAAQMELRGADKLYPTVGSMVTRREANGLINMGLCFLGVTAKNLGKTDNSVSVGQISIQSQCALTFGNAMANAVGDDMDSAIIK